MRRMIVAVVLVALATSRAQADEAASYVDLSLDLWMRLVALGSRASPPPTPPTETAYLDRSLQGGFRKGLLSATLVTRFEVYSLEGHVRVPILDADATPARVSLDGKPASLVEVEGMYTVGIDRPGVHQVEIDFHRGQEQDRFSRRLEVSLPAGGVTRVALLVPETGIEAHLEGGTLTAATPRAGGTLLEGYLDASGKLDLVWSRRLADERRSPAAAASLEAHARALFTVEEAIVEARVAFDLDVLAGELDRLELTLPPAVEVTEVSGDAVLQFRTSGTTLTVLLRYPVDDRTTVTVVYRYASEPEPGGPVPLRLALPPAGAPFSGEVGVRALAGLDVQVASLAGARTLDLRELPAALSDMSSTPLRFGFAFDAAAAPPAIALTATRLEQVELTSTLIDEIEASTVLLEDGSELGKLRLYIRNNTRQYLRVRLPGDAVLSHALLDGHPVRPALRNEHGHDVLLFSLRQSERIDPHKGRVHRVRAGDTLRQIAHHYYSDPGKWSLVLEANQKLLGDAEDLQPGQLIAIPSEGAVTVEESSFVLELAYRRRGAPLGAAGRAELTLPELDVDALRVTWHLYAPDAVVPLEFDANLTQLSHLRYDPLRRLRSFLDEALGGSKAWAGGDSYESILAQRKRIYRQAAVAKDGGDVSPAAFPLVGQRYRFKRILLDRDRPHIAFSYVSRGVATGIGWGALGLAFALTLWATRPRRRWWHWIAVAVGVLALAAVGHYVLGVHRRILWGVDLGLAVELVRLGRARGGSGWGELLRSPWKLARALTLSNLSVLVTLLVCVHVAARFPMLLSIVALVVLARLWQRAAATTATAVTHAA